MPPSPSENTEKREPCPGVSVHPVCAATPQQETPLEHFAGLDCPGTSSLLLVALKRDIPVLKNNPVEISSIRDVTAGGTYILSHGRLYHDLNPEDKPGASHFLNPGRLKNRYPKGMPVVLKTISPDAPVFTEGPRVLDYSELSTELAILRDAEIQKADVVRVVGLGW